MRIVDRKVFLSQPDGVLFAKYEPTGCFDGLCVKHETFFGFDGTPSDFCYQNCLEILADGTEEWLDVMTDAEDNNASFSLDLDCGSRDGLFDQGQLFALFELGDLKALRELLGKCIPAVLPASVVVEEKPTENATSRARMETLLSAAPRCYYNYDPSTGRRPCTFDVERQNEGAFKASGMPSCPFVGECFTRSYCLYITGNTVSESEGAEQVARDLRQFDHTVTSLNKENTQSLRPYK